MRKISVNKQIILKLSHFMSTVCRTVCLSRESVGFANAQASIQSVSSYALETVWYKGNMGLSELYRVLECCAPLISPTVVCCYTIGITWVLRFWACQSHLEDFTQVQCNHGSVVDTPLLLAPCFYYLLKILWSFRIDHAQSVETDRQMGQAVKLRGEFILAYPDLLLVGLCLDICNVWA